MGYIFSSYIWINYSLCFMNIKQLYILILNSFCHEFQIISGKSWKFGHSALFQKTCLMYAFAWSQKCFEYVTKSNKYFWICECKFNLQSNVMLFDYYYNFSCICVCWKLQSFEQGDTHKRVLFLGRGYLLYICPSLELSYQTYRTYRSTRANDCNLHLLRWLVLGIWL